VRWSCAGPFDGELLDLDDNLSEHTWIHTEQALAVLIDPNSWAADAFIPESEIKRIRVGDKAKLYMLDNKLNILQGAVAAIDTAKIHQLPNPILDAQYGGAIATLPNEESIPAQAYYKVRVQFEGVDLNQFKRMSPVNIKIDTEPKAWLKTAFERVAAVLIRESGF